MRISVALCTYNGARFLEEQLNSIAEQSRRPDEVVICDDVSSDESIQVATEFSARSCIRIRIYRNPHNFGSTKNFEKAIELCTGELVALCDQDDIWRQDKLAVIESAFVNAPKLGAVFSDARLIDENGRFLGRNLWEDVGFSKSFRQSVKAGDAFLALLLGNFVTGATLVFRSRWNSLLTPIPVGWVHDHWIALVLSTVSLIDFIDAPLICYRTHQWQERGVRKRSLRELWWRFINNRSANCLEAATLRQQLAEHLLNVDPCYFASYANRCEAMAAHLRCRGSLPTARISRVPGVLAELLKGNYSSYSFGLKSALRDIVAS